MKRLTKAILMIWLSIIIYIPLLFVHNTQILKFAIIYIIMWKVHYQIALSTKELKNDY